MFKSWQNVATNDESIIARWWQQSPNANVGIVTGHKSNIFAVDFDGPKGGLQTYDELVYKHGRFPDTWQDMTGRGDGSFHLYFRMPAFAVSNHVGLLQGVDIRGNDGQVVAPPSIHPDTGKRYQWDGDHEIEQTPVANAPDWLLDLLQAKAQSTSDKLPIKQRIPHGVQYHTLLSLAGALRRMGLEYEEIMSCIMSVHDARCERPGPRENMEKMVRGVVRYKPADNDLYKIATKLWRLTKYHEHVEEEQKQALGRVDAYALMKRPPRDSPMVIDDCLHIGCTILAGPPKTGKSYLTLGMAISVATGGKFIGSRDILKPGRVGYWALEENENRTAKRLHQLINTPEISLQNLEFMYHLKPMFSGGLEDIALYCDKFRPNMLVIDTLMAFVTGDRGSRHDVFRDDYREIKALSDISLKYETALLVVHHTNKLGGGSIIGSVAGTHGLTAAADCIWKMDRQPSRRATLEMTGREVEDQSFLIELDIAGQTGWQVIEQGDDVILSGERQVILEVLRESGPKTPKQLSMEIGKNPMATRQLLYRMIQRGLLIRDATGTYRISTDSNRYSND